MSKPGRCFTKQTGDMVTPWRRTVGFPSFGFTLEDAFMPWKETRTVDQRLQFLSSYQKEEMSVTDLCHEYGISRATAYKWIKRYDEVGPEGLLDLTRTPHGSPYATPAEPKSRLSTLPTPLGNPSGDSHIPTATTTTVMYLKTGKARRKPAIRATLTASGLSTMSPV